MPIRKLALLLLLSVPSYAAVSATMQWEVRTGGSDNNGGGFDSSVGSPGTDFSLQDAAQQAYTDIVIGGTTTQITSAAHAFGSTHPGNVVNITGGAGCTTGRFEINSVSGVTATMDRSVGTGASTCTGNMGGGLANASTAVAAMGTAGNTIWIKSGTYTYSSTTTWQTSAALGTYNVTGYSSSHSDNGTRPLITTATNSVNLVGIQTNNAWVRIHNINFSNTAGTSGNGLFSSSGANFPSFYLTAVKLSGFTNGIANTNSLGGVIMDGVEITGCTSNGAQIPSNVITTLILHSNIHDNTGTAGVVVATGSTAYTFVARSLFTKNPIGLSISAATSVYLVNNTFADNTSDGFKNSSLATTFLVSNNIFWGNTGIAINITGAGQKSFFAETNAFGSNTGGNTANWTLATSDITGVTNPFTNDTSNDFSLNRTAGAGALLRGTGSPGTFSGGSTGYLDIGAVESQCGGAQSACGFSMLRRPDISMGIQ